MILKIWLFWIDQHAPKYLVVFFLNLEVMFPLGFKASVIRTYFLRFTYGETPADLFHIVCERALVGLETRSSRPADEKSTD